MANEQAQLAEFADNLWENYIKQKIEQNSTDVVTYFKAEVVTNNGDGTLTVKQPFDNPITVHASWQVANTKAEEQVLVLRFGDANSRNYLAICRTWDDLCEIGNEWRNSIEIPQNSDFNNYYTYGKYVVTSNVYAATMQNAPSTTAGILLVIPQGKSASPTHSVGYGETWLYTMQIYIPITKEVYVRIGNTNGTSYSSPSDIIWGSWTSLGTINSVNDAGLVPAPTSSKPYYMYATDARGNPNWYDQINILSRNLFATVDGSGFSKNFKLISTTDKYSSYHRTAAFYFDASTKSNFSNIPTELDLVTGAVIGIREVYWRSTTHILVKVTEMYPNIGREHCCFYNNGNWTAWFCKGAGYLQSELIGSGASDYSRIIVVPLFSYANLGLETSTTDADFFKAWLKKICELYPNRAAYTFIGNASPNSRRMVICFIYNTSTVNSTTGLPEAAFGTVIPYHSSVLFNKFGTSSYSWYFHTQRTHTSSWGTTLGTDGSSVANNTTVDKGSFSLEVGVYIVGLTCSWQANSAGRRTMAFGTSSSNYGYVNQVIDAPGSNGGCAQMLTTVINVTNSTTKYHMYLIQNSGSALTTTCRYGYIRIA